MTAVEKLELSLLGLISFDYEELRAKYKERIAKAKEMEKQQIIDAYIECKRQYVIQESCFQQQFVVKAEQYYNETFNK